MNGIEKITQKITDDARAYAAIAVSEAEKQVGDIDDTYDSEIDYMLAVEREKLAAETADLHARAESGYAMAKRNALLKAKSELIDAAYKKALEYFLDMPSDKYRLLLEKILTAALNERREADARALELYGEAGTLDAERYEIILCDRDKKAYGTDFLKNYKASCKLPENILLKLYIADKTADIAGGMILRYGDIESNCSLEMLISRNREDKEGEVCTTLFGS